MQLNVLRKWEFFLFLSIIFESENIRFPFPTKISLTYGSKICKIKLQKIVGNILDKLWKLYLNGIENLGNIRFSEQIFTEKQSLGAPGY